MQKWDCNINPAWSFSQELLTLPYFEENDVLYDVESLFTNILVKEIIDHIMDQILYAEKGTTNLRELNI